MIKRKIIGVFTSLALVTGLFAAAPLAVFGASEPAVGDNIVRVHLNSYGTPASVTLNAAGSYKIQDNDTAISGSFTVAASGSGLKLTSGSTAYNLDDDIYIKAASLAVSNTLQIGGGYKYPGDLRIMNKNGKLKLVNHVDIETYVMGVLPYEMNNAWPAEALKAQAVAARTYAYYVMHSKIRTSVEQDLVNSTAHQVYYGYNASYGNCINAVTATKNTILKTSGGQIVYACFSASNGGMTETGAVSGASASNYDYLPLKEDPYDLKFALAGTAYSGKLTIPKTIAASDLKGSVSQPYKMFREKLAEAGVDTNAITQDVTVKSLTLTHPRAANPERIFTGASFVLGIPGGADTTLSFAPVSISGSSARYPFLNNTLGLGTKFVMLALRDDGTSWTLASVRYGHGAGLSQVGAYQMAAEGKTYKDILAFYYNVGSAANLVTMPWDNNGGTEPSAPGYTVTAVSKTGSVNTPSLTLNVRSGPGTGYSALSSLKHGAKVTINGQVSDWWRIDLGSGKNGFVSSAFIKLDADSEKPDEKPVDEKPEVTTKTGKVNTPGTTLNVRSGPGTNYSIIGSLGHNAKVTVTEENSAWFKLSYNNKTGYISRAFVVLDSAAQTPAEPQTKTVYVNTPGSTLNVRSGAGISHAIIGSLKHGAKITVTDIAGDWYKLSYNSKTGYVSKAWTKAEQAAQTPSTPSETQTKTVYVNTPGLTLNVRSGPGTSYGIIGSLKHGAKISVTDENNAWYKLTLNGKTGYVSKTYVATDPVLATTQTPTSGTVTGAKDGLYVRSGAGTNYKIIGGLSNGTKITIQEKSGSWYKIKYGTGSGWVSADYVKV